MVAVPDSFLHTLVSKLDNENTVGITLSGSLARGEGDRYSDVDIQHYVRIVPETKVEAESFRLLDGFLVSVHASLLEDEAAGMRNPHRAIWVVPGLRQARILLDKEGAVARVIEAARAFCWADIQPAADAMVSWQLCSLAEEVYKILGALDTHNESKTIYAVSSLLFDLTETLLVQHGVLVPTENAYFDLAQKTAGRDSDWTHQLRLAAVFDLLPSETPVYVGRGVAAMALYRLTAELAADVLRPQEATVIQRTIQTIAEAGYA
jgi:predicted nucleotidyltransferase